MPSRTRTAVRVVGKVIQASGPLLIMLRRMPGQHPQEDVGPDLAIGTWTYESVTIVAATGRRAIARTARPGMARRVQPALALGQARYRNLLVRRALLFAGVMALPGLVRAAQRLLTAGGPHAQLPAGERPFLPPGSRQQGPDIEERG